MLDQQTVEIPWPNNTHTHTQIPVTEKVGCPTNDLKQFQPRRGFHMSQAAPCPSTYIPVLVAVLFTNIVAFIILILSKSTYPFFALQNSRAKHSGIACLFSQRNRQTDATLMVWHFQMRDVKVETTYHLPPVLPFANLQRPIDVVQR